jgi:hypothetical protein
MNPCRAPRDPCRRQACYTMYLLLARKFARVGSVGILLWLPLQRFSYSALALIMDWSVFEKRNMKIHVFPENGWIEKLIVPSWSDFQRSCQCAWTILNFWGQFLCPALGDRSHHQSLSSYRPSPGVWNSGIINEFNQIIYAWLHGCRSSRRIGYTGQVPSHSVMCIICWFCAECLSILIYVRRDVHYVICGRATITDRAFNAHRI